MKRIYLDQNMWIYLARADKGLASGARYQDVLTLARAGVQRGLLSFPLSGVHYIETTNRPWRTRQDLARTMTSLSRFHTIAAHSALVPPEIDCALRRFFGRPLSPRSANPFGSGFAHAIGKEIAPYRVASDVTIDSEARRIVETSANGLSEWLYLAGLPDQLLDEQTLQAQQMDVAEKLAKEQEQFRLRRVEQGWHTGRRAQKWATFRVFAAWEDEMIEALGHAALPLDCLSEIGPNDVERLVESMPIIHCASQLELQREATEMQPWTSHDILDVMGLSLAIVHCDVVVTEKRWVDRAKRSELDQRNNTVLLRDLPNLAAHLI